MPIKMLWSREEDMAQGRFHPVAHCKLVAGLDDKGRDHWPVDAHRRTIHTCRKPNPQVIRDGKGPGRVLGLNPTGPEASG